MKPDSANSKSLKKQKTKAAGKTVDWCLNPPEWFVNQLRMNHLIRWSTHPEFKRGVKAPDVTLLAKQLGRMLAEWSLDRKRTSAATTKGEKR